MCEVFDYTHKICTHLVLCLCTYNGMHMFIYIYIYIYIYMYIGILFYTKSFVYQFLSTHMTDKLWHAVNNMCFRCDMCL